MAPTLPRVVIAYGTLGSSNAARPERAASTSQVTQPSRARPAL